MRQFLSNTIAALAAFIELDATLELGEKNGAMNVLNRRVTAERQATEALEGYARAWAIAPREMAYQDDAAAERGEQARARRISRKASERARQESRANARRQKEMRLAY